MKRRTSNPAGWAADAVGVASAVLARGLSALARLLQGAAQRLDRQTPAVEPARAPRRRQNQLQVAQTARLNALGEMAATLAHELSQPLAAISSYAATAQRLSAQAGGETELGYLLRRISDQADRATSIVGRIRQGADRSEIAATPQSLPDLFSEVIDVAMGDVAKDAVVMRYEFDPAAEHVLADRVQVQQVVLNLLRNAFEAMAEGPWRELRIGAAPHGAGQVRIHVIDSGAGISQHLADQLFQPFVTDKPHGMGVGLSLSRTIVEAHGGRIWAQRAVGGGAAFYFTLPCAPQERTIPQTGASHRATPGLRPATS